MLQTSNIIAGDFVMKWINANNFLSLSVCLSVCLTLSSSEYEENISMYKHESNPAAGVSAPKFSLK